jgi:TPR repeat protein
MPVRETTEVLALRGEAEAQFSLGVRYANTHGVGHDYAQAEFWYLKAAAQDHPLANFNLGKMYATGQGGPADPTKAMVRIQRAADLGEAAAQNSLGETYHRAILHGVAEQVAESRVSAYKWFRLAAGQGYKGAAIAYEMVNLHMTRAAVQEGERKVAAFQVAKLN